MHTHSHTKVQIFILLSVLSVYVFSGRIGMSIEECHFDTPKELKYIQFKVENSMASVRRGTQFIKLLDLPY